MRQTPFSTPILAPVWTPIDSPPHYWKTTTLVAGLRVTGIAAPFVLDGPINRDAFQAYVERVLVPSLPPATWW